MTRARSEDVGTTPRKPLTPTQRLKLFEAHKGLCVICKLKIEAGDKFIDEHVRPLALGGTNDLSNRGPAHIACAAVKTEQDMAQITKAKRQKMAALGIKAEPAKPLVGKPFAPSGRRKENPIRLDDLPRRGLYADAAE